jgi:hypothetical protein
MKKPHLLNRSAKRFIISEILTFHSFSSLPKRVFIADYAYGNCTQMNTMRT